MELRYFLSHLTALRVQACDRIMRQGTLDYNHKFDTFYRPLPAPDFSGAWDRSKVW